MKFYIHIGTHKTGTTAIQSFLRENRKVLKRNKAIYISRPWFWNNIHKYESFTQIPQKIIDRSINYFGRYSRSKRYKIGILSWEGLSGNPYKGYTNAKVIAEFLSKIFDKHETYIILYLRRQDDFLESLYMQMVHEGNIITVEEFKEKYIKPKKHYFDYLNIIEAYEKFFPNKLILNLYEKERYIKDFNKLIFDFLSIINLPIDASYVVKKNIKANIGFSEEAYVISQLIYPKLSKEERRFLRRIMQQFLAKKFYETYHFFSYKERLKILSFYEESNKKIARKYFNREVLFEFKPEINDNNFESNETAQYMLRFNETLDLVQLNKMCLSMNTLLIKYLFTVDDYIKQRFLKGRIRKFVNSHKIIMRIKEFLKNLLFK